VTPRPALVLLLAIAASVPGTARSQPAPNHPAETAYQEGIRLYDLHEWDQAIAKFKEAYRLRKEPRSLFNIAQAYRLKGDCVEALAFYRTYRRNYPDAPNIKTVNKFIETLEPCASQQASQQPHKPAPADAEPPATEPTPPTPREDSSQVLAATGAPRDTDLGGSRKRTAGIAIGAAGVAAVATGVYFGLRAHAKADQVEAGSGQWDPSLEDSGERADLIAKILWSTGGAAIAAGGVLLVLGRRDHAPHVAVVPAAGGGWLVWEGRF